MAMKDIYKENFDPIATFDYRGKHCRIYAIFSKLDVGIYSVNPVKRLKTLYGFRTISDAKTVTKYYIDSMPGRS